MPGLASASRRQQENLRRRFRPVRVRLLFAGESPPASGRFFYQGDSGLYRAMRDAFQIADRSITDAEFLATFQDLGCYFVDLCPEPVDHLPPELRRATCRASEASFARTIARFQPAMIATVVRSIEHSVTRAALQADWHGPFLQLPYPGRWSRYKEVFVDALIPTLRQLLQPSPATKGLTPPG
jgi:hypothetical protein